MNRHFVLAALLGAADAAQPQAALQAALQGPVQGAVLQLNCSSTARPDESARVGCSPPRDDSSRPRPFVWDGSVSGLTPGGEPSPWLGNNPEAWSVARGLSYSTRHLTLGVGLQAHHGHHVSPAGALGEFSLLPVPQPSFADVTGSRVLDARLMVKRRLYRSRRGASIDAVVEALLPLAGDAIDGRPSDDALAPPLPLSFKPIRSRSLRFGIVLSFD